MNKTSDKYSFFLICWALALITFFVFCRVLGNKFVDYDDNKYVTDNKSVQAGLKISGIKWAFTTTCASNWHPVTWLSHMLDCQLFGLNPKWHHLVNLLFHITNTLLLFWLLKDMTAALCQSAFVAAAFAVHPLHVESVAWASERKDVLSALFWLLAIAGYVRYAGTGSIKWYAVTLLLFVLGLLSKPMLVTLPFVLLLLDYWPLGRLQNVRDIKNLFFEKLPFFALSVISGVVTFLAQQKGGAVASADILALRIRFANAVVSYMGYIGKMVWPANLAVLYPYHINKALFLEAAAAAVVLLGVSILVFRLASKHRYLPLGWLWYLGTLAPVIGFIQVGTQALADRYTYIPLTGLFIIIAWGTPELFVKWRYQKVVIGILAGIVLLAFSIGSYFQVGYWRDSNTLFEHTLKVTGDNSTIHYNLGNVFHAKGNIDEAIAHYRQAVKIRPDYVKALYNLGSVVMGQEKFDEAVDCFNQGLYFAPDDVELRYKLALALMSQDKLDEAEGELRRALEQRPDFADAQNKLGEMLESQGRIDEAISHYRQAIRIKPDWLLPLHNLSWILATCPDPKVRDANQAIILAGRAAELTGYRDAMILNTLSAAYAAAGQPDKAIETAEKALQLASDEKNKKLADYISRWLQAYKEKHR